MSDEPARFSVEQRELFRRVATTVRSAPLAFVEAGHWLDRGADLPSQQERLDRVRRDRLRGARARRQCGPDYLVTDHYGGPPCVLRATRNRNILAREIKAARVAAASAPSQYEIIASASRSLLGDPPNYDALRPDLAERQARRVLLVVWILTDPADLKTKPPITKLQDWEWGEHVYEFLEKWPEDSGRPTSRLFARANLFDLDLDKWTELVKETLAYLTATSAGQEGAGSHTNAGDPIDPSAYVPAANIVRDFSEFASTHKQLVTVLAKHPGIRRWRPFPNRLRVHLADWHAFVASTRTASDGWSDNPDDVDRRKTQIRDRKRPGK